MCIFARSDQYTFACSLRFPSRKPGCTKCATRDGLGLKFSNQLWG